MIDRTKGVVLLLALALSACAPSDRPTNHDDPDGGSTEYDGADDRDAGSGDTDAPTIEADASLEDPDPPCWTDGRGARPLKFSVSPDIVCLEGRQRVRCLTSDDCGAEHSCCWGVCMPDGAGDAFCGTCPCGDDPACEGLPERCDEGPKQPFIELPALISCDPTPICKPEHGAPADAPCGFKLHIGDPSDDEVISQVACHADGVVEKREKYLRPATLVRSRITRTYDACGDTLFLATSSVDVYDYPHGEAFRVELTGHSGAVTSWCSAEWNASKGWQRTSSHQLKQIDAQTWTDGRETLEVDVEGRVTRTSAQDYYHYMAYAYDDADRVVSRSLLTVESDQLLEHDTYEHDERGQMTRHTFVTSYPCCGEPEHLDERFEYDDQQRLLRVRNFDSQGTETETRTRFFDEHDYPVRIERTYVDANGVPRVETLTPWTYDADGRLVGCEQYPFPYEPRYRYLYDPAECVLPVAPDPF